MLFKENIKNTQPYFFAVYGTGAPLDVCKMLLLGVGTTCPPGKHHSEKKTVWIFVRVFKQCQESVITLADVRSLDELSLGEASFGICRSLVYLLTPGMPISIWTCQFTFGHAHSHLGMPICIWACLFPFGHAHFHLGMSIWACPFVFRHAHLYLGMPRPTCRGAVARKQPFPRTFFFLFGL